MYAAEIATAFNSVNSRTSWSARPNSRSDTGVETVHFTAQSNLVALVYYCDTGKFAVRFNKFHATWGDYVRSIARALYVVLTTLKEAGLDFDAPDDSDGMEIIATSSGDNTVYVRWPAPEQPLTAATAVMPEMSAAMLLGTGEPENVSDAEEISGDA